MKQKIKNAKKHFCPEGINDGHRRKKMKPVPKEKYKRYTFSEE